jgi:hypothetical protein
MGASEAFKTAFVSKVTASSKEELAQDDALEFDFDLVDVPPETASSASSEDKDSLIPAQMYDFSSFGSCVSTLLMCCSVTTAAIGRNKFSVFAGKER